MLRQAREAAGLHIAALAVSMKVPVKKLEALETDRLDLLPDAVFVRALASSVCRALKIDPAPVLKKLPPTTVPRIEPAERGINTPFHAPGDRSGSSVWNQLSRPVVLAALVLLVGALVLIFFPSLERTEVAGGPSSGKTVVSVPVVPPVLAPQPIAAGQFVEAVVAPPPLATTATPGTTVPGSGATTGVVVLKTRNSSWVEVTDASGAVQLRKTIFAGETVGATGALPLSVIVGRADVTDVQVRGKPFDLLPLTKDNVARFEVK